MKKICPVIVVMLFSVVPLRAYGDVIDNVLQILYTAGMIDKAVVDGKPVIECLLQGNSIDHCANQSAQQQTSSVMPDDPKVQLTVKVIKSAKAQDWLEVLEVTSAKLLPQLACSAGIPGGGPVKDFICSGVFSKVIGLADPVVRQILIAVKSGDLDDWLKVAATYGPGLACSLMPDSIAGKDIVCGTLAEILNGAAEAVAAAGNAAYGTVAAVGEWISGQSQHMPPEQYYNLHWKPWYHYAVKKAATGWNNWGGMMSMIWHPCKKYFDSHKMSEEHAQETCDWMRSRFNQEANNFYTAIKVAPDAYIDAIMKPLAEAWAIYDFPKDTTAVHKTFIVNGCEHDLRSKYPFPLPDPRRCEALKGLDGGMFEGIYQSCLDMQKKQLPEPTVWEYLCKPVGDSFVQTFKVERQIIEASMMSLVHSRNCSIPKNKSMPGAELTCYTRKGYNECLDVMKASHPEKRCSLNVGDIAKDIIKQIGGRRCRYNTNAGIIECYRPWKADRCRVVLADNMQQNPATANLQCAYIENPRYLAEIEKAEAIVDALNDESMPDSSADGGKRFSSKKKLSMAKLSPAASLTIKNCRQTWDPLGITCNKPEVIFQLPKRLDGATLKACPHDPDNDGADAPCYSGNYPLPPLPGSENKVVVPQKKKNVLPGYGDNSNKHKKNKIGLRATISAKDKKLKPLPDYQVGPHLKVGKRKTTWGGSIQINSDSIVSRVGEACKLPVAFRVVNNGSRMTAAINHQWRINGRRKISQFINRVPPKGKLDVTATLPVQSGSNMLELVLDPERKVKEINENNNVSKINIHIVGECQSIQSKTATQSQITRGLKHAPMTKRKAGSTKKKVLLRKIK